MFIENRVSKIRKRTPAQNWRHIPTELNPADIASRGVRTTRAVAKEIPKWIQGPELIRKGSNEWPEDISASKPQVDPDEKDEVVVNCTFETGMEVLCLFVTDETTQKSVEKVKVVQHRPRIEDIIAAEKFSCLWKLLRLTAWWKRFVTNLRQKVRGENLKQGYLTMEELKQAEATWIISVQRSLEKRSKQLNNTLGLYLDERGVLLCKGRLENADLTLYQKHPILIPGESYFAKLLAFDAHLRTAHGGYKDTLVELRSMYWVTKARSLVRHVIRKCPRPCNRLEAKPFKSTVSPPLPSFRVRCSFPFANTGVDYLGPLLVRQVYDDKCREMYKTWVVLYTCAVTRAVHLDLVPDTSASAFLRSFTRFRSRRSVPNLMISDNATCFKNEEVKLNAELLRMRVKWKFIVEASPWWGGFWERLVQTVKRSLRKVLFRASVNYEELLTIVIEIEGIMNSRPLTYDYSDDIEEIVTPSHLLIGKRLLSTFEEPFDDGSNVDNAVITKRMKYIRSLSEHYWKRFSDEYLLELRSQHVVGSDATRKPDVGEVVVIGGTTKRNDWRLGKIVSFLSGSDNRNRGAIIKVFDGTRSRYIKRPIERLYPTEVRSSVPISDDEIEAARTATLTSSEFATDNVNDRPTRVAADNGILYRRLANLV